MDCEAAGCSSPSSDGHSERSEPEGVMPPSRYKGPESNFACRELFKEMLRLFKEWGGAPLRLALTLAFGHLRKAEL